MSDKVVLNGKTYRIEQLAAEMTVPEDQLARMVGSRITGEGDPCVYGLAKRMADNLVRRPGAISIDHTPDLARYAHRVRARVLVLFEE